MLVTAWNGINELLLLGALTAFAVSFTGLVIAAVVQLAVADDEARPDRRPPGR